jgi:hypothetical protein
MPAPILSICVPTFSRRKWLQKCLEATLPQIEALPEGLVELVVSDNNSVDDSWAYLQELAAVHPCLTIRRNERDLFTENFYLVVQAARGRFAWLMGDDDAPLPGAVARVLEEVQARPRDLYLLHALETDAEDHPLERRQWFHDLPGQDWNMAEPGQLVAFLNHADYMAGAFGFISILVFNREAWLPGHARSAGSVAIGWPHVAMALDLVLRGGQVRVLPDTLVLNRLRTGLGTGDEQGIWNRIMQDLRGWVQLAGEFCQEDPELRRAFIGVMRRSTSEGTVMALRIHAPSQASWEEARALLLSVYYPAQTIAATELAYDALQQGRRPPSLALDPGRLCVADLGFVARGARRTAVLVRDPRAPEAARVIRELQARSRALIRIYGQAGSAPPEAPGCEWRPLDLERFVADQPGREPILADFRAFAPDLVVNADPGRHPALDLVFAGASPVAAIAFPAPASGLDPGVQAWLDGRYHWLVAGPALAGALGFGPEPVQGQPDPLMERAASTRIASQAFLMEPDWAGTGWLEVLLSYLDAFKPGEPVALVLYLGPGPETVATVSQRVLDAVARSGRSAFPDVLIVDTLEDLARTLETYPVHGRVRAERGSVEGLAGPFGQRLAQSRLRLCGMAPV